MPVPVERITIFCFAASYAVALACELILQLQPGRWLRILSLGFGAAGLLAHTLYVAVQPLKLGTPDGSLLFLAWILALFYLYGSFHHRKVAWGLFVLPLVLGLTALASLRQVGTSTDDLAALGELFSFHGEHFWGLVHGCLVLLAAVGICVGFVASVMYLVQVHRLRQKVPPGRGVRVLSLERLESMSRRAVILSFPLLTAGLLVGAALLLYNGEPISSWRSPKILSAVALWLVFAILLYLRYRIHARGRQVAVLTILAFVLLVLSLASPVHPFLVGGGP
jgi:ABC-type transport system involved in cytochrome c biogenesis permease subunit